MTTTISLPTRDCIVIGCDSLATSVQTILDPSKLLEMFFDDDGSLKTDNMGNPVLSNAGKLKACSEQLPRNQLPNVTKIFPLTPYRAGLLFAGISGIGSKSIRTLVETFIGHEAGQRNITDKSPLREVGNALLDYLDEEFATSFPDIDKSQRPVMEILLSGYSCDSRDPQVFRLSVGAEKSLSNELENRTFNIVLGGQHDVIERVVTGIDFQSYCNLKRRSNLILDRYRDIMSSYLIENGITDITLPFPDENDAKMDIFGERFGGVSQIFSDYGSLSEQAAINFVEFLINTMINAQDFSDSISTVGGQIHVAIITPSQGFRWISKEEYKFQGHSVPRYDEQH